MSSFSRVFYFPLIALVYSGSLLAADPIAAGVPKFRMVNEQLYRGAQPSDQGFASLSKLGIKTVIDLRNTGDEAKKEEQLVSAAGMRYVNVALRGMQAPSAQNMSKIQAVINDPASGPVFVHCRQGVDRTGTVVACYRIAHDKWDNRKALEEARAMGMHWIERAMMKYVMNYKPPVVQVSSDVGATAQ